MKAASLTLCLAVVAAPAAVLLGGGYAQAATVALDATAGFRFSVVDVAFALPVPFAPQPGLDYELTITETTRQEQRGAVSGPASAMLSVDGGVDATGGEGAVGVSVRAESPAGQVNNNNGSYGARVALRQLGDFSVAVTLEYALEGSIAVEIDNPGAAVDPAAAFGSVFASVSSFGFEDILDDQLQLGFNNFSDPEPLERVDFERFVIGETRRVTLVNRAGLVQSTILLSAFAGGQALLGDGEPVVALPDPVVPIPLPAAGWMLLTGVGALAALRRRRG